VQPRTALLLRAALVLSAGLLLFLGAPAAIGADPPGLDSLRERSRELEVQSHAAVVELYALETRIAASQAELARLQARAAAVRRLQRSATRRYIAARRTLNLAQQRLGEQLRLLYQSDEPDPLAILLGATSLSEALEGLENLSRTARMTDQVIDRTRSAKVAVTAERRKLARRRAAAARAQARAAESYHALLSARSERAAYLARLRTEQQLTETQISQLEARAQEAQERAQQLAAQQQASTPQPEQTSEEPVAQPDEETADDGQPQPNPAESVEQEASTPPPTTPPPTSGRTVSVVATAYCLKGTTATGLPVGPGIVAVDPSFIPLGTRMTIPGYGEGVAADTGGAIIGNRIDLWMPCPQADVYGSKTLTITLH
jgi:3D (Asp-Asp-Asp) domain-containing protein/peptidoglycan hydrolase CwlO-like protein